MNEFVQIGNFQVPQSELVPLLKRYQLLPDMLRELTIDRAITEVECSADEQMSALKQFYDRYQLTDEARLEQWLKLHGLERPHLTEIAIRNFKIDKFKHQTWGNKVSSYFFKRKAQLDRAIYSLIRTSDIGIAQEIYFRSIEGEQTFEEIARQYSQGAESKTGGLIGPVELSTPHPAIAQLIMTQPIGQVCHPVQLEQWYVIIRPEQIIPAQLDEPMRQRLIDELFQAWLQEQI
ncbi:MAG: peptidylprolyl isomerase [Chamaesiphon sp.]|nr:peptidylprolyl isomerase [Chamaesiphon sp.]